MMRNRFILSFLVVGCTLSCTISAYAQKNAEQESAQAETVLGDQAPLEATVQWEKQTIQVESRIIDKHRTVILRNAKGNKIGETQFPYSSLTTNRRLTLTAEEQIVRGHRNVLDVQVLGESFSGDTIQYQIVFLPDRDGRNFQAIWSGRHAKGASGDRFAIEDIDGDHRDELVIYAQSDSVYLCGDVPTRLYPRVWNWSSATFEDSAMWLPRTADIVPLEVQKNLPHATPGNGANPKSVSSNLAHKVSRSYGRAPTSLVDNDPSTAWYAGGVNHGVGHFVTFTVNPLAGITGISFVQPAEKKNWSQRVLIFTEAHAYRAELPSDSRAGFIPLPSIENSRCASVIIERAASGASHAGFAELHLYTGLDTDDPIAAFERRVLHPYLQTQNRIEQEQLAELMITENEVILRRVVDVLPTLDPKAQVPIVGALSKTQAGRNALQEALQRGQLTSSAIAALGRSLHQGKASELDILFDALAVTDDANTRVALIRVLSRSVRRDDALRLLPLLADADMSSRGNLVYGLSNAGISSLNEILHALGDSPSADQILLRSAIQIVKRSPHSSQFHIDEKSIEALRHAIHHDDGSIARMAYELTGMLDVTSLLDELRSAYASDPHEAIRLSAMRGLVQAAVVGHREDEARKTLRDALRSEDPTIRIVAARRLHTVPLDEETTDQLYTLLANESWSHVSRPVLVALVRQGSPALDTRLVGLLPKIRPDLTRSALVAWQTRNSQLAADTLLQLLPQVHGDDVTLSSWVRTAARTDERSITEAFEHLLVEKQDEPRLYGIILEAMGRQGVETSIPTLVHALQHAEDAQIRHAAARGLAHFTEDDALYTTLHMAQKKEKDPHVLQAIHHALRAIDLARRTRELLLSK